MSNFRFIEHTWPEIFKDAHEAEENAIARPRYAGLQCRIALERGVNWIFENDPILHFPYDTSLSSLIHNQDFRDDIKPSLFSEINLIRKIGNNAAHGRPVSASQAVASVKYLYGFLAYLSKYYSEDDPEVPVFSEHHIPDKERTDKTASELQRALDELEKSIKQEREAKSKLEDQARENELLKRQLEEKKKEVSQRKQEREKEIAQKPLPGNLISEKDTRIQFIDVLLIEAGWDITKGGVCEFPVVGMPLSTNPTGRGYVDYVLWGDDSKPLAIVEAKRTMEDARKGKHQAELYANCLEEMYGQRPLIYYTNGFDYWLWDDTFYPERKVSGFGTKDELQLLVNRRQERKDIRNTEPNTSIVERPYQLEAIKRVTDAFVSTNAEGKLVGKSRKSLLVMATGTGKTRTAVALVDILVKSNWAKRVLFLADRNALVTQAKNAFNEHLPHLTAIDLTKEKEDDGTRLVFSTYPTILNKIDSARSGDERFYTPNHFDLIIIDEAHRSVYVKYKAIFDYFDSLLIGLTATPKKDVDRNTYELFELNDNDPTFAYELNKAVDEGFLVPPKAVSVPIKLPDEGIRYDDLSESEKKEWEEKFGDPTTEESPDTIGGEALNQWLFNTHTVDVVLNFLMKEGIKVGGDLVGKTILFARSHKHALFIEERFNALFPELSGKFLRVIDNYESHAQSLLEDFCRTDKLKDPRIAVSVDMMDTGVDAPDVVNLVFFKPVRSLTKFWQMIGRGTRLREDLFGPGLDKKEFFIFDFCRNFEFFAENPEGATTSTAPSLTAQIFTARLDITQLILQPGNYEKDELKKLRNKYLDELHGQIASLDRNRFLVQSKMQFVVAFSDRDQWEDLSRVDINNINTHLADLPAADAFGNEFAKRFDLLVLQIMIMLLTGASNVGMRINRIQSIARSLLKKKNIPAVYEQVDLLTKITDDDYMGRATLPDYEHIRNSLRELIQYLDKEKTVDVYTSFEDEINEALIKRHDIIPGGSSMGVYKERVERYIREHQDNLTIMKLRNNQPITQAELEQLENLLFDGDERGTREEFIDNFGEAPLGKFIRSIVGLDSNAAQDAFSSFIQSGNLSADQITFIQNIISFLTTSGTIDKSMLFESPPFTNLHDDGAFGIFDDGQVRKVISILDRINANAEVG